MRRKITVMTCVFLFLLAVPVAASTDTTDAFIVTTDDQGIINYAGTCNDTPSSEQTYVGQIGALCYGAGIGDFDNDGNHDIVVARGHMIGGEAFLYRKVGVGADFVPPKQIDSWMQSKQTRDIAVGDFDGDSNLDFIISQENTGSCTLYLSDGNLNFAASELSGSAPSRCMGIDAADFDNDGHEDFIVASYEETTCQLYVNIGNGDGSFVTNVMTLDPGHNVWGVAAADFDNDDTVDIVATFDNGVYFYSGNGNGTFCGGQKVIDDEYIGLYSPVDNYDFDGDGNQDIVVGNYFAGASAGQTAVALFYGTGTGAFSSTPNVRSGGSGNDRIVVAAPPPLKQIKKPIAIAKPEYQEITVGHAAVLDASESYSPNGTISGYEWDFGDGTLGGGASNPHVYHSVGLYTATLTVTDDQGAEGTTTVTVKVLPVQAQIKILPNYLKLDGQKGMVNAAIILPDEYSASRIDLASVSIARDDSPLVFAINKSCYGFSARIKKHFLKKGILYVKFDKKAVADIIDVPSSHTVLRIQGKVLKNGHLIDFEGKDTIRTVKYNRKHYRHSRWYRSFFTSSAGHSR